MKRNKGKFIQNIGQKIHTKYWPKQEAVEYCALLKSPIATYAHFVRVIHTTSATFRVLNMICSQICFS